MKNPEIAQEIADKIRPLISIKKSALYENKIGKKWLEAYKKELSTAKEIFPHLHLLEIFLRNKIAIEFGADFGAWLLNENFRPRLAPKEQEKLEQALIALNKFGKDLSADNIISSLSLGFWTNLFHRPYKKIWQKNKMIERVFSFLKSHQRNLAQIQKELEIIRKFRNRIFHFESLQSCDFEGTKQLIGKFIYGLGGVKVEEILDE